MLFQVAPPLLWPGAEVGAKAAALEAALGTVDSVRGGVGGGSTASTLWRITEMPSGTD